MFGFVSSLLVAVALFASGPGNCEIGFNCPGDASVELVMDAPAEDPIVFPPISGTGLNNEMYLPLILGGPINLIIDLGVEEFPVIE